MTTPILRSRLLLRLAVCCGLLLVLDLWVRSDSVATDQIDQVFLRHYRMPNVLVPPLDAYASAIGRARNREPQQIFVGFAGPSFIYGTGVPEQSTFSAQVDARIDSDVTVLNVALPGNRYDDDRIIARRFAGVLDAVLVPYSAGIAEWSVSSCPQHLALLEWGDSSGEAFELPATCEQPPRHRLNNWLDEHISNVWAAYSQRAGLRKLIFPEQGDFGNFLYEAIYRRASNRSGHLASPNGKPPEVLQMRGASEARIPVEMQAQIERLCESYASRGTRVFFYQFPQFERPDQPERELTLLDQLHAAIRATSARQPLCQLLAVEFSVEAEDYRDYGHPNQQGFGKLAVGMSAALVGLMRAGLLERRLL